jgi:hypothetical protein
VLGVVAILAQAVWRLAPLALEPLQEHSLSGGQALIYAAWVAVSLYAEGYRAFQLQFSPRVVARALYLARNPRIVHIALAPAFCMALIHATRRRLAVAWGTTLMIVALVMIVRRIPQPWRGIIDGGVVVALFWGMLAILYFLARALMGHDMTVPSDVPAGPSERTTA